MILMKDQFGEYHKVFNLKWFWANKPDLFIRPATDKEKEEIK